MKSRLILLLLALSVPILGGELAKWVFALDIGQAIPDRSGNGYDWSNGSSHHDTTDDLPQQIHRGIYGDGTTYNYALCPSTSLTSNTFALNSSSADFSIGMFVYDASSSIISGAFGYCSDPCTLSTTMDLAMNTGMGGQMSIQYRTSTSQTSLSGLIQGGTSQTDSVWQFINLDVYYTDRPTFEIFIDGVSQGVLSQSGVESFTHKTTNPALRIGRGEPTGTVHKPWIGFISHVIIMTPGQSNMSSYFDAPGTGSCSALPICMTDPELIVPGRCTDLLKTSDWNAACACSSPSIQCHLTSTDWNPCTGCPQACTACRYDQGLNAYSWVPLHASLTTTLTFGVLSCACADGYTLYNQDPSSTPDQWCASCHSSWRTCANISANQCETCSDTDASVSTNPGACSCNDGYYATDTINIVCSVCDAACATWSGPSSNDCLSWPSGLSLAGGSPNSCQLRCSIGQYLDTTVCQPCEPAWAACTGPGTEVWTECNNPYYRLNTSCKSTCDILYYGDTTTSPDFQCIPWVTGCQQCTGSGPTDCISWSISYFMQTDGFSCSQTWPVGWFGDLFTQTWQQCPSNCDSCSSTTSCIVWSDPYVLRDDGSCNVLCQDPWYADIHRVCQQCYGYCTSCTGPESDKCIACALNLSRSDPQATQSSCNCDGWSNSTKGAKLAWIKSTQAESTPAQIIFDLNQFIESESLTQEDLNDTIDILSSLNITDVLADPVINTAHNAGSKTLTSINDLSNQVNIRSDNIDAQYNIDTAESIYGTYILTSTGSGIRIPADLPDDNRTSANATLVVSVVQFFSDQYDAILESDYDIVSVEIEELVGYKQTEEINFDNLTTNFTIIFNYQDFNVSEPLECVYLRNSTWSTDGCWLDYFSASKAWWLCNHLTSFSLRNALKAATVDNNAASTIEFADVVDYSLEANQAPRIVVMAILIVFFIVFIILRRGESRELLKVKPVAKKELQNKPAEQESIINTSRPPRTDERTDLSSSIELNESNSQMRALQTPESQTEALYVDYTFRWISRPDQRSAQVKERREKQEEEIRSNVGIDLPERQIQTPQRKSFKELFLQRHPLIGVFYKHKDHNRILSSERLTIYLSILMITLFVLGLFYDQDQDKSQEEEDLEEKKSILDVITGFTWTDFWIIVYSICITIPVPFILRYLFKSKRLTNDEDMTAQLRCMKVKRFFGYVLAAAVVGWSSWSWIMWSLNFGYNTTTQWMISFGVGELFDFLVKDNLVTLLLAGLSYGIKSLKSKRKSENIDGVEVEVDADVFEFD